jgi:HlyD family secretion protein
MKKLIVVILAVVIGGFLAGTIRNSRGHETVNYRLVAVEKGDLEAVVSATGTLDAVTTVQVGTQVSGIIDEICVDYNDPVGAGQVVARIDTTLLANAVAGAEAQRDRADADLRQAQREHARITALHDEELVSDSEANGAQYDLDVARASVQSAAVDLARSRQNLSYATITSPIAGTVISRSVDVGQTVQSSFSSPELFLIAGDLTRMQILVAVDESDIGQIVEGQTVRFSVQAYPDDSFTGTVRQMRLQSSTEENVVNYTAVVDVGNPDGRLLPGMTATVDFIVETAADVLYVSNASLRYKPDQETMAAAFDRFRAERESLSTKGGDNPLPSIGGAGNNAAAGDRGLLWAVDDSGQLAMIPVRTGISNGTSTVVTGRTIAMGQQVIAGISSSPVTADNTSSPFQQNSGQASRPGPPSPGGF